MQMKYDLPRAPLHIDLELITRAVDRHELCYVGDLHEHLGHNLPVIGGKVIDAPDVFARHYQQMDRGLGASVLERHDHLVLIDDIRFSLPGNNLAERAFVVQGVSLMR